MNHLDLALVTNVHVHAVRELLVVRTGRQQKMTRGLQVFVLAPK